MSSDTKILSLCKMAKNIDSRTRLTTATCVTLGKLLNFSESQSKDKMKIIIVLPRDVIKCLILKCIYRSAWYLAIII